jgi:hypothetical protein
LFIPEISGNFKKQLGTKDLKIQGEILKARRGLIQVQKHQGKRNFIEMLKN